MQWHKHRRATGKPVWILMVPWLFTAAALQAREPPRASMSKGLKAYKAGDYTNAVGYFEKAVSNFPAIGRYNLGTAHYRLGEFEAAAGAFNEALHSPDLGLHAAALYNRGCALLAQTAALSGPEQISTAVALVFEALGQFEKTLLLDPGNLHAKQNLERAQRLWLKIELNLGIWLFDRAEGLLAASKAKEAREHYRKAQQQFIRILEEIDSQHTESGRLLPIANERLAMLDRAVATVRADLATALQLVDDYQYVLADKLLAAETDKRKYAFDMDEDLKNRFKETIERNQQVLQIVQELFEDINTVQ